MLKILLPAIFTKVKKENNLKYKKGSSRRRVYIERKVAKAEEKEKRRYLRVVLIKAARKVSYNTTI